MGVDVKAIKICFAILLCVIALVVVIAFFAPESKGSPKTQADSPDTDSPLLPASESSFIGIVSKAQADSRRTENDMQKGGVKAQRDRSICSTMGSFQVQDWVGTVKTIDSNSDGKGVLEIEIAPDVLIKTWNNELSDFETHTLIDPGSPVFAAASAMKTGNLVDFSGTFLRAPEGDCLSEGSLSLDGKLQSPEFIFRFSKVSAYDPNHPNATAPTQATEKASPSDAPPQVPDTPPSSSGADIVDPDSVPSTAPQPAAAPATPAPLVNPPSTSAPPTSH
jgi:hypothetical protein